MAQLKPQTLVVVALFAVLLVVNVVVTHNQLTAPYPGHNDFMSRWEGARSYWVDGLNPYGEEASLNIQERIYGRTATADEDPGFFAYPFYTVFYVLPVVFVDYAWASALWMVLLEVALIGALVLLLDLYQWRPRPLMLALLIVWALVNYHASRGLILGQPGHLVYFLEVVALWGIAKGQNRLAGIALALSTIKPQMGFLIVPALLLWALYKRRWNFVGAFTATFAVLMAVSFVLLPSWMGDWLAQVSIYTSYTEIGSPVWVVMQYYLGLGLVGEYVVVGAMLALLLWAWWSVTFGGHDERFWWTVALTLTVTHLAAVRTATPHFVLFTVPLVFYFRHIAQTYRRSGGLMLVGLIAIIFIVPWIHFLLTVEGEFEDPATYLPLPFLVFFALLLTRRLWWRDDLPESLP